MKFKVRNKKWFLFLIMICISLLQSCTQTVKLKKYPTGIGYGKKNASKKSKEKTTKFFQELKDKPLIDSTGNRSKASIIKTVMKNIKPLRYEYNRRLRKNDELYGKITIKFAIDHNGAVLYSKILFSSLKDSSFENYIRAKFLEWKFDTLSVPDTTEPVYPLVFSSAGITKKMLVKRNFEARVKGARKVSKLIRDINKLRNIIYLACCNSDNDSIVGYFKADLNIKPDGFIDSICIDENTINDTVFFDNMLEKIKIFDFKKVNHSNNTIVSWDIKLDKQNLICPK